MISCTIKTSYDFEHVQALCKHELARTHERSKTLLENSNNCAVFTIEAKDVTALRAATNTITSILGMYEKTQEAINGKQQ